MYTLKSKFKIPSEIITFFFFFLNNKRKKKKNSPAKQIYPLEADSIAPKNIYPPLISRNILLGCLSYLSSLSSLSCVFTSSARMIFLSLSWSLSIKMLA